MPSFSWEFSMFSCAVTFRCDGSGGGGSFSGRFFCHHFFRVFSRSFFLPALLRRMFFCAHFPTAPTRDFYAGLFPCVLSERPPSVRFFCSGLSPRSFARTNFMLFFAGAFAVHSFARFFSVAGLFQELFWRGVI